MHRRLLPGELWRWYRADLARPAAGAVAVAVLGRIAMPQATATSPWLTAAWIAAVGLTALIAALLLATEVRPVVLGRVAPARP
jgi:hypothetical protein